MAVTPEGKIKKKVSELLRSYHPKCYYFMPVQSGIGASTLDYIGAINGVAFAIETKAPGKKPTPRQETIIYDMKDAGMAVFVISSEQEIEYLRSFLYRCSTQVV